MGTVTAIAVIVALVVGAVVYTVLLLNIAITLIVALLVGAVVFVVLSSRARRADHDPGEAGKLLGRRKPRPETSNEELSDAADPWGPPVPTRVVPVAPSPAGHPVPPPAAPRQAVDRHGVGDRAFQQYSIAGSEQPIGAPLEPDEPRQLGPYRVLSRLGQGGFGSVYLGVDRGERRVAIKLIRPEYVADEGFRERFRREAASAQRVARHSTAEVLDFDESGPQPYLVTEYIDGPTLYSWVRENGPMRGSMAEQLAIAVATALAAIHRAGIVHRDLKPSNVLLSPAGPRVIDFGISRAVDASDVFSRGTTHMGTLGYMAPEQIRGQVVTPKTDVFAWGALMAFAGTGTPPFGSGDPATVMYRTLDAVPDLDRLDAPLRLTAQRALAKDPARRPSVAELLAVFDPAR